jgi:predicted O-linked N-acetylglucosamine transferase (SPINDLY family)
MYLAGHCNLGNMLFGEDLIDDAIATYRRALELDPRETNVLSNLAGALARRGQVDEALDLFRQALGLKPEDDRTRSSLLFQMHFSPSCPARDILQAAREWDRHHGAPLAARHVPHGNDRTPDRRLRVGYVSPDFRRHCQSLFVAPLLANHDHERFEIFCYADVSNPDPFTSEVLRHADRWRSIAEVDDDVVAALIREDRIDVLVDLTMHMGNNRLRVFARKPAPVQITWLAYPGTTGLSAIDYRLSDPILDPPGSDTSVYAEQTLRLPDVYWCYAPLTSDEDIRAAPDRLPPPADGHVRFGCLNNFCKVHEAVIALWSRVLQAVPGSTMAVLVPPGESRVRARATFEKYGSPGDRLEFLDKRARPEYLATYRCMDVCLDTFPYNGHTTSLDAFWMGTPVVTLVAPTVVGRAGLCQATHLELPELVAHDDDDYVTIATRLAMDRPRLAELRATLRSRMERSPLMDAPRFARGMEVALRTAWESWCVSA